MRVTILAVGRLKAGPERDLAARYLDRAGATGRNLGLAGFDVVELAESRAAHSTARKKEEARALAAAIPEGALTVVMDERGRSLTSEKLASTVGGWRDQGKQAVFFVIGGADGLDRDFMASADTRIAFSEFTWPHQLVRIMLAEQLYRVTTILSGHPYHRGR